VNKTDKRPKKYSTKDSTGFLVRSLHQSFNRNLAQKITSEDLTTAQWYFLRALWEKEGVAQKELSRSVGLTESTTVAALKILEKKGLIKRKRDVKDTRRINVSLTSKGRSVEEKLLSDVMTINSIARKGYSAAEIKAFHKILRDMQHKLEIVSD
jgi:MarR family transcriptional regulator, organic hydroperoxide resistance regulator